ncbi:MAG: hypothetical protein AB203_00480 [Parcubacteria bacterium C7867-008]|nr:MAG: hypothetical protein AB203_00480 [Parcubacteria bacterium C7867-008]
MKPKALPPTLTERVTTWIGSRMSLVAHTIFFIGCFFTVVLGLITLETMLLVLTTAVSLEAIYLAIFIQMTVNANTASLREVEEDIEEIQEDVEELGEDLDEIQEDIGEIQEDVEEISEDIDEIQEDVEELSEEEEKEKEEAAKPKRKTVKKTTATEAELLEQLSQDVAKLLADLEALKKGKK